MSNPSTVRELTFLLQILFAEVAALKSDVVLLKQENLKLNEELSIYKNKKNWFIPGKSRSRLTLHIQKIEDSKLTGKNLKTVCLMLF